jgi:hypothetical protein
MYTELQKPLEHAFPLLYIVLHIWNSKNLNQLYHKMFLSEGRY